MRINVNKLNYGTKIGLAFSILHFIWVILTYMTVTTSKSSTAGLAYLWFMFLDAPISFIWPTVLNQFFGVLTPLIQYGLLGSFMWYFIPYGIDKFIIKFFPKLKFLGRSFILILAIPVILLCFSGVAYFNTLQFIKSERPSEIASKLNSTSSNFLTAQTRLEEINIGEIRSIKQWMCTQKGRPGFTLSGNWGIATFDPSFNEQNKVNFEKGVHSIFPIFDQKKLACNFFVTQGSEGSKLLNSDGNTLWSYSSKSMTDGAIPWDSDNNGEMEIVLYHRYRTGIHLLDSRGSVLWTHPVSALGHIEVLKSENENRSELIYSHSNNANGFTDFKTLTAEGKISKQFKIATPSSEFNIIEWPAGSQQMKIMLTENNVIKIVDLEGRFVSSLEAPGSRAFGMFTSQWAQLKKDSQKFLVVRKQLHPDIVVLYVYQNGNELVYQRIDQTNDPGAPIVEVLPSDHQAGTEKLLIILNGKLIELSHDHSF